MPSTAREIETKITLATTAKGLPLIIFIYFSLERCWCAAGTTDSTPNNL
jgi:hypothetical protein